MTVQDLVDARLYRSEEEAIQDAVRHLLRAKPEARLGLAIHRYQNEEGLTLARAAQLAGVSWARMREILRERGVEVRLGPETEDEARQEIRAIFELAGEA